MSGGTGVNDKKQNFFKPIASHTERQDLIHSLLQAQTVLQIKQGGIKTEGPQSLTLIRVVRGFEDGIGGSYVSGPALPPCEVTVAFELERALFFGTGRIAESEQGMYAVFFKKIFELQRRDAYRVNIDKDIISARLTGVKIDDKGSEKEFRISDLSAGGMGLAVGDEDDRLLPSGSTIHGQIRIASHEPVEIQAKIKYHRKVAADNTHYFHIGCEFLNMNASLTQKIGFLVNDCHRISFSRLQNKNGSPV